MWFNVEVYVDYCVGYLLLVLVCVVNLVLLLGCNLCMLVWVVGLCVELCFVVLVVDVLLLVLV